MLDVGRIETDKLLARMEQKIADEYKRAEKEIAKKLDDYLKRFEVKDALKRDAVSAGTITQKEYEQWRVGQIEIGKRWSDMKETLAMDYHHANEIAKSTVNEYMPEVYALNHNYGTFEVEKQSGLSTSYTLYDKHAVQRLMRDNPQMLPPPGKAVSQRIAAGKDVLWNQQQIQSVMTQSLLQGEAIPNIAKRLAIAVGEKNFHAAIRNARTMTTRAENYGRLDAYKRAQNMGIELRKQWISMLDHRTRDSHVDLDGEVADLDKPFSNGMDCPGGMGPPEEVYNCRCRMISVIKGYEINTSDMSLRTDAKLGDMTYDEWKQQARDRQTAREQRRLAKQNATQPSKTKDQKQKTPKTTQTKQTNASNTAKTATKSARFDRKNGIDSGYKKSLESKYAKGTDAGKKAYDKYVPKGGNVYKSDALTKKGNPTAYIDNTTKNIYMNFAADSKNVRGAGTTWFHEHGHYIDVVTNRAGGHNDAFLNAIKHDAKKLEREFKKKLPNHAIGEVRRTVSNELNALYGAKSHSVQDILGGTIKKPYPGATWAHTQKYWRDQGEYGVSREAFAHMFEAQFDPEKIAIMEKHFPTAWKEFNKILGGLI